MCEKVWIISEHIWSVFQPDLHQVDRPLHQLAAHILRTQFSAHLYVFARIRVNNAR